MWRGNMLCGVTEDGFLARVSPDQYPKLMTSKDVKSMLMKGKPLKGFILVPQSNIRTKAALKMWMNHCEIYSKSLPKK